MDGTDLALGAAVGVAPPEPRTGAARAAAWQVGDTLSCVLHLGDAAMAYVLADQGHEVIVAGDDVTTARHPEIVYVRSHGERLPFGPASFDVVVAPRVPDSTTAVAEYARVLRPGGLAVLIVSDAPALREPAREAGWKLRRQLRVRVLGQPAQISAWRKGGD